MKILSILGVRPNFVKEFAIQRACKALGIEEVVAHTGQHYDFSMSDIFFRELELPKPKYHLDLLRQSSIQDTATMIPFIADVIQIEKPDLTLVYGDVNSSLAAAIASVKCRVPVAHIEAGVRGHSLYNPEEINRRVTDVVSEFLFPNIEEAKTALLRENQPRANVFYFGDVVNDAIQIICREQGIHVSDQGYNVLTVHRQENADSKERMHQIVHAVLDAKAYTKFPVHPRMKKQLLEFGLWEKLESATHIEILPSLGYVDFVRLLAGCNKLISDSGGARREAYILGKPVVSLIDIVWVPSMVKAGWEFLADANYEQILYGILNFDPRSLSRPPIFGDGNAAMKIMSTLREKIKTSQVYVETNRGSSVQASNGGSVSKSIAMPSYASRVSIVIPVYNEEDSLPALFYKLDILNDKLIDKSKYELEFVFVDDCSKDKSNEMLQYKYQYRQNVKIVRHEQNRGLGGAIKTGFRNATGDLIVTIDADSNYDHFEIPNILKEMVPGVDLVTASPFLKKASWNYPVHRFIFSQTVVQLYKFALRKKGKAIHTFTSGFRVYRKSAIPVVMPEADGFLATAECLVRAILAGLNVREFHAIIHERLHGESKLRFFRTTIAHLGFIRRVYLNQLKLATPIQSVSNPAVTSFPVAGIQTPPTMQVPARPIERQAPPPPPSF
jgi:UDP-GlcNAc3NAcA epimerase